jgi:hypothetical protein
MAAPTITAPNTLLDPGYLFWSPFGTAVPTHTVTGSKFTDTWSAPWVWLGPTTDGSELQNSINVEYVRAAEIFDPVGSSITERTGQVSFALLDITLTKLKYVMNGGTVSVVSGTAATTLNKFTPPQVSSITRASIGWESTDGTMRVVLYQALNTGDVTIPFKRAPDAAVLPATFSMEVPAGSSAPWEAWTAGVARS